MTVKGHDLQPAPEARALSRQGQAVRYAPYQAYAAENPLLAFRETTVVACNSCRSPVMCAGVSFNLCLPSASIGQKKWAEEVKTKLDAIEREAGKAGRTLDAETLKAVREGLYGG
jgi:hypothetical protein